MRFPTDKKIKLGVGQPRAVVATRSWFGTGDGEKENFNLTGTRDGLNQHPGGERRLSDD